MLLAPGGPVPPTSDQKLIFAPVGPTNNISTSSGKVWLNPVIVTVSFVKVADVLAATTIAEG
jgi:hypothetical protein